MKQLKISLKHTILLMAMALMAVGCQKEDTNNEPAANQVQDQQGLKVIMTNWKHFSEDNITASKHISKLQEEKTLSRNTTSEEYGFIIDTSRVQVIEQEGFTTYAFYIMRPELNSNIVENYVYKEYDNGDYAQYLLTYNCVINEDGATIHDAQSLQVTPINDSSLLSRAGCEVQFVGTYDETVCEIRFRCTGVLAHEIGDDCPCGTPGYNCIPPGMSCYTTTLAEWSETCPGGNPDNNPPDPNNPGGGTGTTTTYTTEGATTVSYPVQHPAFYSIIECINGTGFVNLNDTTTIDPTLMFGMNLQKSQLMEINNYLNQNQCSEQAQAIIIEDFLNPYISVDDDVISTNLLTNDCAEEIIRNEIFGDSDVGTNAGLINSIRDLFSDDNNVTLVFRNSAGVPNNANAATSFDDQVNIDNGVYEIIITLSNDYLANNPTKLSLAMTAIHEMVHAKLMYSYLHGTLLIEYPTYTDLNNKFTVFLADRTQANGNALNDAMHIAMVDFIGTMSYSLYKYAQRAGMTNVTEQYCKDITKGSFYGTPAMNLIDTGGNTPEELDDLYTNEQNNNTNAQGDDC